MRTIVHQDQRKRTGDLGEEMARKFLEEQGMEIVETQYRFGHGEIDIVARDGGTLVFCEVKTRLNDRFGEPEYALTPKKQQQLRKVAQGYLFEKEIAEQACRFDVIAIRMYGGRPELRHIRNAF